LIGEGSMSVIEKFDSAKILCLGDVMLDRFVSGVVKRISPESPIPILSEEKIDVFAGGAANVARNISSLGGRCTIVGVVGNDKAADTIRELLETDDRILPRLVVAKERPTSEKTRFVTNGQHLLRVDSEVSVDIDEGTENEIFNVIDGFMGNHDVLILSDYAKGVLTKGVLTRIISLARARNVPVIVDPKSKDFSRYSGSTLLTPNSTETRVATGIDPLDDESAIIAGREILKSLDLEHVLITRAEKGMTLVGQTDPVVHISAAAREVSDVVGAGDTVIATLSLVMACGGSVELAAHVANTAAGIVVGKRGTATTTRSELMEELAKESDTGHTPSSVKVLSWEEAKVVSRSWQNDGLKVGFTNGCFDILHVGHTSILDFARSHCDRLIVGVNADASIRRLKGPERPINSQDDRANLLSALAVVDAVVIFDHDTPKELIDFLEPSLLVKGADYKIDEIVGADSVLARGGEVLRFELLPGKSTTGIIKRARTLK